MVVGNFDAFLRCGICRTVTVGRCRVRRRGIFPADRYRAGFRIADAAIDALAARNANSDSNTEANLERNRRRYR